VLELLGQSCMPLVMASPPKQQIACTCSFERPVTDLAPLVKAVSHFAQRAAEKLRAQPPCWCLRTAARSGPTIPRFSECATVQLSQQMRDQPSLLPRKPSQQVVGHSVLMEALARINRRWGKGAAVIDSAWQVKGWHQSQPWDQ
jgi:hypothetical protein